MCRDILMKICGDEEGKWFLYKCSTYKTCFENFDGDTPHWPRSPSLSPFHAFRDTDSEDESGSEKDEKSGDKEETESNYEGFELDLYEKEGHTSGLCIENPSQFLIQLPKDATKGSLFSSIYYKRCDGLYKNALGHRLTNVPRSKNKVAETTRHIHKNTGADYRISRDIMQDMKGIDWCCKEDKKIRLATFYENARYYPECYWNHDDTDLAEDSERHLYDGDTPESSEDGWGNEDKEDAEDDAEVKAEGGAGDEVGDGAKDEGRDEANNNVGVQAEVRVLDEAGDSDMDDADEREDGGEVDEDGDSDMDN